MERTPCEALAARFESGDLACTGPKHFPPESWRGPEGIAAGVAAEVGAGARPGLERVLASLRAIRTEFPDFDLAPASGRFLELHETTAADPALPAPFKAMFSRFLMKGPGEARWRKGPQLDNTAAFLEEVRRLLPKA